MSASVTPDAYLAARRRAQGGRGAGSSKGPAAPSLGSSLRGKRSGTTGRSLNASMTSGRVATDMRSTAFYSEPTVTDTVPSQGGSPRRVRTPGKVLSNFSQLQKPVDLRPSQKRERPPLDFPPEAIEPKIQYEDGRPGQVPKRVVVERVRRLYDAQNLEELLAERGLSTEELRRPSHLPLEFFDDSEFDSRNPEEWKALAGGKYVPGMALRLNPGAAKGSLPRWVPCRMIDIDVDGRTQIVKYLVEYEDTGRRQWVPRINLYFKAESPFTFADRVAHAYKSRTQAEATLRYHLYVDSMPTDCLPSIPRAQLERLLSLAMNVDRVREARQSLNIEQLVLEVQTDFQRSLNRLLFDDSLVNDTSGMLNDLGDLPPELIISKFMKPAPMYGRVTMPEHDYEENRRLFAFNTFMKQRQVIRAMESIRDECFRVLAMPVFSTTSLKKAVGLEEFEQLQVQGITHVSSTLKEQWLSNLRQIVRKSLDSVGKGWLNLRENNREVYEISKLKKLLTCVRFIMEDTLRFLVDKNLEHFVTFVEKHCSWDVDISGPATVELTAPEDISDEDMPERPLFVVQLSHDASCTNSPGDRFLYVTVIERFVSTTLGVFDRTLVAFQGIPQLEPSLMDQFFWSSVPSLTALHGGEDHIKSWRLRLENVLRDAVDDLKEYLNTYEPFLDLLRLDPMKYIQRYEEENHTVEELTAEVQRNFDMRERVLKSLPAEGARVGPFRVDSSQVRMLLANKCHDMGQLGLNLLAKQARAKSQSVDRLFAELSTKLNKKPQSIEQVVERRDFVSKIPSMTQHASTHLDEMQLFYTSLEGFRYLVPQEDFQRQWIALGWPNKLNHQTEAVEAMLLQEQARFLEQQHTEEDLFQKELDKLARVVAGFAKHVEMERVTEIAAEVQTIQRELKQLETTSRKFRERQALFEIDQVEYSSLSRVIKDFEPFGQFWVAANNWTQWHKRWLTDPFENLDPEAVEKDVTDLWRTMFKSVKFFKDHPKLHDLASSLKQDIDSFQRDLPIVISLRNPGMRDRHWDSLSEQLGFEVYPGKQIKTLTDVFKLKLSEQMDTVTKVCEVAGKEYSIEQALDKMQSEWTDVEFEVVEYKETGTYVIRGSDDVIQLLDDHIVMTQSMSFSQFKKPFEERIADWEHQLQLSSDIIEEWLQVQRNWLYLEPIFSAPDIIKQLPTEGKRFATVDRTWRKIMSGVHSKSHVMRFCTTTPKLLESLQESNKLLDMVQKGLNDYLETKRQAFARFYFLSNDELLEILSQTKEPRAVQPHLRKCFENVHALHFEEDLHMTSMRSGEGEMVPFTQPLYPEGNVEEWLSNVEKEMKASIRAESLKAVTDYAVSPRTEWVFNWPGQCILVGSQVYWTKAVVEALESDNPHEALKAYYDKLVSNLNALAGLVRGDLSKLNRLTLGALITIEVHQRDVVQTMVNDRVSTPFDFQWISQMRYTVEDEKVFVKQVEAAFEYGYEYLGNTMRLVITPLTDRIYLTLTGAYAMHLGGAPAGPAGTGKTETVKDLAKALAKQCVVFNCQEGLDYLAMGKFFKGLAMAGAWSCFDEFNRIDIEVLSVIAQQMTTIQQAIIEALDTFVFEGVEISLDPTCAVYITMNPGYAGRTELPDNLKALFRPVACMIPDYALIAEIRLYSFGFQNSRELAQKMVSSFRLSSEQLSSQDHYDFGMRAVNTVIAAAGLLKRDEPDGDEELLLLRALRDSNLPKFLADDIVLFNGIISDLFPGSEVPKIDYGALMESIRAAIKEQGLQPTDQFCLKCIQLYETTILRHGLMLVGPTGAGKTSCYRVLARALTLLACSEEHASSGKYQRVKISICNPKSITMGQLYGQFDETTHEWTDGILANLYRDFVKDTSPDRKWLVFDGPVDALWIESMNTVLDDNKKLCLVSGEIIAMTPEMNIMFEVEDLAVASPATVSRCGMVYMEPSTCIGIPARVQSWFDTQMPPAMFTQKQKLQALFEHYLSAAVEFVRANCREYVATVDNNIVHSTFRLLNSFFKRFRADDENEPQIAGEEEGEEAEEVEELDEQTLGEAAAAKLEPEMLAQMPKVIEPFFLFSLVWGVGGALDEHSRNLFSNWLRNECKSNHSGAPFPKDGLVYDYVYDEQKLQWVQWLDTQPAFTLDPRTPFVDIIVPTMDTIRYTWILEHLLTGNSHVLCVGPTGTGKTLNVKDKLMNGLSDTYIPQFVSFSARTSANMTQDILDSKMEKRRKGIYGPPAPKKYIVFVDDFNMPQREVYGAQPPVELLRQWMDHGGWYDRRTLQFHEIIDIVVVAAMGPPGGGRNPVSNRMLRHFNFISFPEMSDSSKKIIFGTILDTFLNAYFPPEVQRLSEAAVEASIALYSTVTKELLPTPNKSHYTYNLRDLANVFEGILSVEPKSVQTPAEFLRLWCHECERVVADRLVDDTDRGWFKGKLKDELESRFKMRWNEVVPASRERLLFGDYMIPGADPKLYCEVRDFDSLVPVIQEYLDDLNASTNRPMKLVMFSDAIEHVSRISRVLRQPGGNALLLGVGGSGRQSLTRLASYISEYELFQIEVQKGYGLGEWRDDVKKVVLKAGLDDKKMVFLCVDTQIVHETMLEDVNNLLNTAEVPNLFDPNDMDNIISTIRPVCQAEGLPLTKVSIYARFIKRVKFNLHIVLAMSPIGETFRNRLRMFPSLVNCCTIDWFSSWPDEALLSVAKYSLGESDLSGDGNMEANEELLEKCMHMFSYIHQSVEKISLKFLAELSRHNYVTPTSYLELLNTFRTLLKGKREELMKAKKRLVVGLKKLESTEGQVKELQEELAEMKPVLIRTTKEVEDMMVQITKDKEEADQTRKVVVEEEDVASKKAEECREIKEDAERDLAEALPALDAAVAVLKNLKVADLQEVASYKQPPSGVILVMEAVCIMKAVRPKKIGEAGKKVDDYWEPSKEMLRKPAAMVESLLNYDKDNIPDKVIKAVTPYIDKPDFEPKKIESVSKACTAMCQWVRAMYKYHFVALGVAPKRERLKGAEEEYARVMSNLEQTRKTLADIEDRLMELEVKYEESNRRKEELQHKVEQCNARLDRAEQLIGGLGGEKKRWQETVESLGVQEQNALGDMIVASGEIAYVGAFTAEYREALTTEWRTRLEKLEIAHSEGGSARVSLADPVKIRTWTLAGLPTDSLSVENAIILSNARRWPLMIDPQGQANKWIKNLERDSGLEVLKLSDRDFLRTLENAIRFGRPVLLENVLEELDPALEPILLKQTFKQGGAEVIALGDNVIPYHPDFRFFMTTKLRNPHYSPETTVKVTVLNFFVTPNGLQDQLLGILVAKERPDLEDMKNQLLISNAKMKKELKEIENNILKLLEESSGDILDDEELINTLSQAKSASENIKEKVQEAEETEVEIDTTRNEYKPVAYRASLLFFCVADMALVDPMYQYSLQWFANLFENAIENSEESEDLSERLTNLNDYFTYSLYQNVCRSLFEVHKLLFSFTLCVKIRDGSNGLDHKEWRFLLSGVGTEKGVDVPNPAPEWLVARSWTEVCSLTTLPSFKGLVEDFVGMPNVFKRYFEADDPQTQTLAGRWGELSKFQMLLILRCLRPDKLVVGVQEFVASELGHKFIEPPTFNIKQSFEGSSAMIPLVFILSAGSDPAGDIYRFADDMRFSKKLSSISLGQGQGPIAERMISDALDRGAWVLLQNCHLASSWMPQLERIVEQFQPDKIHRDFRLWLTSMPSPKFPVSVLQNSVKMTNEPPKGLKANLTRTYDGFDDDFLGDCKKPAEYRKLLFALSFFHAIVLERRKFGPLGWNIRYEFTEGDLKVCVSQLKQFLDMYDAVPFEVLNFLTGQINYGGRVTDDWDRRCIMTILSDVLTPSVLEDQYKFSPSGIYKSIEAGDYHDYLDYIRQLPINAEPSAFGLHANADITCAQAESYDMLSTVLSLQPRSGGGAGKTREEVIGESAQEILDKTPSEFDVPDLMKRYPTQYEESMNTVLVQESIRYNRLLVVVRQTLKDLLKALKGLVVMSEDLEKMSNALFNNQVPEIWAAKAYPSLKPLSAWVEDLVKRCKFIDEWAETGRPAAFWISGFFFPQAFLTGTLQNYARKYKISIDSVAFDFDVLSQDPKDLTTPPEDGVYIYGLFLEGASWNGDRHSLDESHPRVLFTDMKPMWLKPVRNRQKPKAGIYDCPVYKTLTRAGTLSTTGHSTNYVLTVELPSNKDGKHWIKRGVALICSLNY